jgi:hypothetical protein
MVIVRFWSATAANFTDPQRLTGCAQNSFSCLGKEVSFPPRPAVQMWALRSRRYELRRTSHWFPTTPLTASGLGGRRSVLARLSGASRCSTSSTFIRCGLSVGLMRLCFAPKVQRRPVWRSNRRIRIPTRARSSINAYAYPSKSGPGFPFVLAHTLLRRRVPASRDTSLLPATLCPCTPAA